jgi:hypothetical protein
MLVGDAAGLINPLNGEGIQYALTTYNPRLPLVGDRVMLVGDAAGLINPLNGEGIQYALHSARWAADIASDCLPSDRLDTASLHPYQQRVQHSLGQDMAFSRLVVQLIRNRRLNPVWLRALRVIASQAKTDPDYAYRVGCMVTGLAPATRTLGLSMAAKAARQTMISARADGSGHRRSRRRPSGRPAPAPSKSKIGGRAVPAATSREFADWAAGIGRALTELIFQLSRAKLTRSRNVGYWDRVRAAGRLNPRGHRLCSGSGSRLRPPAGGRPRGPEDMAGSAVKDRFIYPLQTRVINPIVMLAHQLGIPPPGDALLETTGVRRPGRAGLLAGGPARAPRRLAPEHPGQSAGPGQGAQRVRRGVAGRDGPHPGR